MVLSRKLGRSLRARDDDSASEPYSDELEASSPSVLDTGEGGDIGTDPDSGSEDDDDADAGTHQDEDVQEQLSKISFGTLAKAHDSLHKDGTTRKRKRGSENTADQEDKLQALRERLRQLKKIKGNTNVDVEAPKKSGKRESQESDSDNGSESSESEEEASSKKRKSKNAPAVMTSKKPVSRKREVVPTKKRVARDPRFDKMSGPVDENKVKHKYAFLDQYRESEMAELKATIKKTKDEEDKEILKRKLLSMESQKKARESKERQEKVVREHRKSQKEAIKQGKTPYYLKKSEAKKLALVDKFKDMKGKDRDKLMERRRKKATGKERKKMPAARRMVE
ncbi:hypothetical protein IWX90DRAFT_485541 [Phyllosticta citrichinensis]|uniref:rRNA biogenesis protein RRP36 n=1 Tax=Phyllosticta citrichinensis TaxID=1130410 RepID=A0ABR1XW07_9PEZI